MPKNINQITFIVTLEGTEKIKMEKKMTAKQSEEYFSHEDCKKRQQTHRVQWWRNGESTRPPPMWPGFDSQIRRHMWVEFDGSLLCSERFFPGYSGFPLSSKTYI